MCSENASDRGPQLDETKKRASAPAAAAAAAAAAGDAAAATAPSSQRRLAFAGATLLHAYFTTLVAALPRASQCLPLHV